jgi:hypothetical protein
MKMYCRYALTLAVILSALCLAAPLWAGGKEFVEPEDSRGIVHDLKPGETAYLARNRRVSLELSMDASQAMARAQKSGMTYNVTKANKPTFNTGNSRERLTCMSVSPQGFLRVRTRRTD